MEILQNLLETEILNEETKAALEKAIQSQINEAVEKATEEAKEQVEVEVRAELAEQFVADKEALVEALDTKVEQFLEKELVELKDDIENFRDLEAEHAEKLVEEKKKLAEVVKKDFKQLVNILNEFLEDRVAAEFEELREDIIEVKKIKFGQKMFEDYKTIFEEQYLNKNELEDNARKAQKQLKETQKTLSEARKELNKVKHDQVLTETLSSLGGKPREIMAAILVNTPTDKIGAVYSKFIGRVLNETAVDEKTEKESKVLAENSKPNKKVIVETVEKNGNAGAEPIINDDDEAMRPRLSEAAAAVLRDLSGQLD